jgi:Domain of unknown function (DUF4252)
MHPRALAAGAVAVLLTGCGITGNFRNDPGYAAFGSPGPLATDRELRLSLGPLPLKLAKFIFDDDAELSPMLENLRAVRVYTYEVAGNPEGVAQHVHETQSELHDAGWISLVAVREDDELTSVLLRAGGGRNQGLAVIVQDATEVVYVNLIGDVRLEFFDDYMAELEVDVPSIEIDPATLQAHVR